MWNPRSNFQFTEEEYNLAKSRDKLPIKCIVCGRISLVRKAKITAVMSGKLPESAQYCSRKCAAPANTYKKERIVVTCSYCGREFSTFPCRARGRRRQKHWFCCNDCRLQASRELIQEYNDSRSTK